MGGVSLRDIGEDDGRWRDETTLHAYDLAFQICRAAGMECDDPRKGAAISSARTASAVERSAGADRKIAATVDQWDADIWLTNTTAATVDLRTGEMREHRREDYITKVTAVSSSDADCPLWKKFLKEITNGNDELQHYLQRLAGYCLTGSTEEQALFFIQGPAANGKSVFINTVAGILGDYAATASMDTFMAGAGGDKHPAGLAKLQGARLVVASETEYGQYWAESLIKLVTGGDRLSVRFMRQNHFEYTPQFKLVIVGNHKPRLRGVSPAMRRRLHLVPFTKVIPPDQRDPQLAQKLRAEWPAILKWMIEGCAAWQQERLAPPDVVLTATDQYFHEQDALGAFIAECCVTGENEAARSIELFHIWRLWAEHAGVEIGNITRFAEMLQERGFVKKRFTEGFRWLGISVAFHARPDEELAAAE
jgi:putative DNA primase/helicase